MLDRYVASTTRSVARDVELADGDTKPLDRQHGRPDLVCGLASQLYRRLFAGLHLLLACPERQHQHLATLAVAQREVAVEAGDGPNHRQHPLTNELEVQLETAVVSDTGEAGEPPEHTTPFGSPGPSPALQWPAPFRFAGNGLGRWP
jgi:hypothetical protein